MSKAFTKEDDGSGVVELTDLPQSRHPNYVTPAGLERLRTRLREQKTELAGLRTKVDELDGKQRIALAERDIRFLSGRIDRAILLRPEDQPPDVVAFGAEIEVTDENDTSHTYRIVGEDAAEPSRGLIAPHSPLAVALIGARVGDSVEWRKPSGTVELVVNAIRYS